MPSATPGMYMPNRRKFLNKNRHPGQLWLVIALPLKSSAKGVMLARSTSGKGVNRDA